MSNSKNTEDVLSLKKALRGLENLFNPCGTTEFIVKIRALASSEPREAWINEQLIPWTKSLRQAGVDILDGRFSNDNLKYYVKRNVSGNRFIFKDNNRLYLASRTNHLYGEIILTIQARGSIKTDNLDSPMKHSISQTAKEKLAEFFKNNFPAPFDERHPNFAAGSQDGLNIGMYDSEKTEQHKTRIIQLVQETLKEYKCEIVESRCGGSWNSPYFKIKWNQSVNDGNRKICLDAINVALHGLCNELTNLPVHKNVSWDIFYD